MNWKASIAWILLATVCVAGLMGCKPVDKKTPDQPAPNTTDS